MSENKTADILCLDDYKNALRGEIYTVIWHNPSDDEMAIFEQYVADYIADQVNHEKRADFTGICGILYDCRREQFCCCADCGEYFLPDEMNPDNTEYCRKCKPVYDPDWDYESSKADRDD